MSMYQRLSDLVDPRELMQYSDFECAHRFLDKDLHDLFIDANRHDHAVEAKKREMQAQIDLAQEQVRVCALLAQTVTKERDEAVEFKDFLHNQFTELSNSYNSLFGEHSQLKGANKALVADNYKLAQERNAANEQLGQEREQSKKAIEQQQARFDSLASRYVIASKKVKDLEEEKGLIAQQRNAAFVRERELLEKCESHKVSLLEASKREVALTKELTTAKQADKHLAEWKGSRYDQVRVLQEEIGVFKQKNAELTAGNKRLSTELTIARRNAEFWCIEYNKQCVRVDSKEIELKDVHELNVSLEETNSQLVDKYNALGRTHECVVRRLNQDLLTERNETKRMTDSYNALVTNQNQTFNELVALRRKYSDLEVSHNSAAEAAIANAVSAAVAEERIKHDDTKEALKLAKAKLEETVYKRVYDKADRLSQILPALKGETILINRNEAGGVDVWSEKSGTNDIVPTLAKLEIFGQLSRKYRAQSY